MQIFFKARSPQHGGGGSGLKELAGILPQLILKVGILLPTCPTKLDFQPCPGLWIFQGLLS